MKPVIETKLHQSYPNPANPTSTIPFSLGDEGHVTLRVYNVTGRLVKILVNKSLKSDIYNIVWDGKDEKGNTVSSGIYFYRLVAGSYTDEKKLLLLK